MRVVEEKKISPKIEETPKSKINIASIIKKNGIKENSEAIEGNLDFLGSVAKF
ncbi:hypothetical protein N8C39_14280 (plasmid) [Enterococcus faecium]